MKRVDDAQFLARFSRELRPIAVRSQLFGIGSWLVAYALKPQHSQPDMLWSCAALAVACAGLLVTKLGEGHRLFTLGGTVQIVGLAWAFRILEHTALDPQFWIMQTYVVIVMIKSVMYVTTASHVFTCVVVGLVLGAGSFGEETLSREWAWLAFGFGSPFFFSVLLNKAFIGLRRRNMELHAAVEEMAFKDALTGMDNRRRLLDQVERRRAAGEPGHFLMVDVDDFKKINDDFGHDVGDRILQEVGAVLRDCPLATLAGRLGGEEFGVWRAGKEAEGAQACARALIAGVRGVVHEGRRVSVSIGVARLDTAKSLDAAMKQADKALYEAKRAGKNCFVFARETGADDIECLEDPPGCAVEEAPEDHAAPPERRSRRG